MSKFWYIYVLGSEYTNGPPPISPHPTRVLYFTVFFDPPVFLRPPVYSGPKSKGLNLKFKIIFRKYIHHVIDLQIYLKW